jgi:hypothetical protein
MLATSPTTGPAARLERLVRSFRELERITPDLVVGQRGTITAAGQIVDADRGVDIRLRCARTGSAAVLRLSNAGVSLRAVSAVHPLAAAVSVIEDQLGVHFESSYRWGPAGFASADELANALLSHLERRLAAVAEVCTPEVDTAAGTYTASARCSPASVAAWRRHSPDSGRAAPRVVSLTPDFGTAAPRVVTLAPERPAPQHTAPQHTAPQHTAPQHTAPQHTAPQHTAPQQTAPQRPPAPARGVP